MHEKIAKAFRASAPAAEYWSLRLVRDTTNILTVRQNIVEAPTTYRDAGAMVTVVDGGGVGYGATCDLTPQGLAAAFEAARDWARATAAMALIAPGDYPRLTGRGETHSHGEIPWEAWSLGQKVELLQEACQGLKVHDDISDWQASLLHTRNDTLLLSSDGGWIGQSGSRIQPRLGAVANRGADTQSRSFGEEIFLQGGLEHLERTGFLSRSEQVAAEALQLLDAPPCPTGATDLVLLPNQMVLQVHESIGHPLEMDRILGDERNYAGTSFVTPEMFGSYRYGSALLNITFDPGVPGETASYRFDDDGSEAGKEFLIRDGILLRPLGGAISQARSGLPGVANSRADGWNRPPIDRMANINLEPGGESLEQLIGAVERGVLMDTNRSWSIDDSRNKFQFGCELGRLIEDGEVKGVVRDPGYRGISATFWRSLSGVGNSATLEVLGLGSCGKGEPNQIVSTGHAAPACRFTDVDLFGE